MPVIVESQHPLKSYLDGVESRFANSQPIVSYRLRVDPADLSAFAVEMRIRNAPDTIRIAMAAHPEYDDRYSRYVEGMRAESKGAERSVTRVDSALWRVIAPGGEVVLSYRLRLPTPHESPRAAWKPFLAPTGGFVGGPHSFMYIVGSTLAPSHVTLDLPNEWDIATGLEPTSDPHTFFAPTVDALMDSPMLVGRFRTWRFAIDGVPHRVVYWPAPGAAPFDTVAFVGGLEAITRQAVAMFGRAPYREFTFIFQDSAYGGLEHRNSVTLAAPSAEMAKGLSDVLSETAHEFTHTWNLMRIRPEEYGDIDYRTQKPVAGLWFSEGLTMHYADLFERRAHLRTFDSTRVAHLEGLISRYESSPGNSHFSAEQISRVAYNAQPGALGDYSASVHLVGELLGTMLDLLVRDATAGKRSMDDVMRVMMERFSGERGFNGRDVQRAVADVCGCDVHSLFDANVRGATPIDFDRYLRPAGLRAAVTWAPAVDREGKPAVDLRTRALVPPEGGRLKMLIFDPKSAWGRAGLHTGDRLISINGKPMTTWPEVRTTLVAAHIGDTLRFEVVRPSGPAHATVTMSGYDRAAVRIEEIPHATARQRKVRADWMTGATTPH
ncbi:MAG: hypothetical protein M3081_19135 [Gemmatimonadota bacterium]|nr:hypothetical protein [Gemmatimonadota bacterium]